MKKRILVLIAALLLMGSQVFAAGTNTFVKSTGGNISSSEFTWTPSITGKAEINLVTVHFVTQSTDEDIRIYLDSELGATYDTVVATSDSVQQNDWTWAPTNRFIIQKDDNIKLWIDSGAGGEAFTATIRGEYQ